MFLLDTVTISELRRGPRANPGLATWDASVRNRDKYISVVTLHELEVGTLRLERRDRLQGQALRTWLDQLAGVAFAGRVLDLRQPAARLAATVHVPAPAPVLDSLIGATAAVYGLTLVTRNEADFTRFAGLTVLNPWT
ncbi:MAG: type II toxin-antitoxin system VapC family toxin [Bifidobacteriaceae bacterium]|jgi:predicted nucleic acid-binding protein|nr:type II toxin-antitoxin system VapC family toxin [Bifidobacteriaceae bacterium]